jgi:ribA/ribD-fused uncharacterized protein
MDNIHLFFHSASPFSQWTPCTFEVDGVTYNCAEQFMMAEKARVFKDEEARELILKETSPKKQKAIGRKVKNYDNDVWEKERYEVVKKGNFHKFTQNEEMKKALLDTADKTIAEASPFDRIWGIGLGKTHKDAYDMTKWRGRNLLGKILMDIRDELKSEKRQRMSDD